jgi:DNA-binding response OmpR family regulator
MCRVLIVDDEPSIRNAIALGLKTDHEIAEAGTSDDALTMAKEFKPHVVLLDNGMPGTEEGIAMARRRAFGDALVMMVTGRDITPAEEDELSEAGVIDVVHKPFSIRMLRDKVNRAFNLQRGRLEQDSAKNKMETIIFDLKCALGSQERAQRHLDAILKDKP